ncbi:hypothetical protein GCM10027416_00240 [Okibacterium endophyticum]
MGFLDRLLGRDEQDSPGNRNQVGQQRPRPRTDDEIAVERYNYLLRTAPPETIEEVHREAFGRLTERQRDLLFQQLTRNAPNGEQPRGNDAASLAQSATRSELRQPGTLERSMAPAGQDGRQNGPSFGSMVGGSLLGTVAGYVIGSALVSSFLPPLGAEGDATSDDAATQDSGSAETGAETGSEASGDAGGFDMGGFDF